MPRTHAADLRTQFEKCIREDGTMDVAIYREFWVFYFFVRSILLNI